MNTSNSSLKAEQTQYTRNLIKVLSYIMAGFGLLNIFLVFAPWMNLSFAFQNSEPKFLSANPSLFLIIKNGINAKSEFIPYFIAIAIVIIIAALLSIIYFVMTLMQKENCLKYSIIASAVFLTAALAAYALNTFFFAKYHVSPYEFRDYITYTFSTIVPKIIMTSALANLVMAALIQNEKKKASLNMPST